MINYNPKSWIKLILSFNPSDTFQMLWKEIIYIGLLSLLIAFLKIHYFPEITSLKDLTTVYSLIGFVISLLLVFRTNTAYDRWWEGRKKWGELVNDTRNMAAKLASMLKDEEDRDFFRRMIPNFVLATKEHLRKGVILDELDLTEQEERFLMNRQHIPLAVSQWMYAALKRLKDQGKLSMEEYLVIDENLNKLLDSLGGCERIKNTPIPFSYSLFLKKFIFIYVTTLPLAFVVQFGYFAALIATFVFYVLVSIEVLAEEIEDPFGKDDNDLPTDSIASRIRSNVEEVFNH